MQLLVNHQLIPIAMQAKNISLERIKINNLIVLRSTNQITEISSP